MFFFHLARRTIYYAYALYKLKKNINLRLTTYQLEVIREIVGKYGSQVRSSIGCLPADSSLRLTTRPWCKFLQKNAFFHSCETR